MEEVISENKKFIDQHNKNVLDLVNYSTEHKNLKSKAKHIKSELDDLSDDISNIQTEIVKMNKKKAKYEDPEKVFTKKEKNEYTSFLTSFNETTLELESKTIKYNAFVTQYDDLDNKISDSRKKRKHLNAEIEKNEIEINSRSHEKQISDTSKIVAQKSAEMEKINNEIIKLNKLKERLMEINAKYE
jgi:chromosome segregation ATPase